ncbi:MAG: MBL fold metallo-hydrolase [Clostridia bacterium]|nr:MBL fold metallo-hydrolase [Clostridia bacterium]
MFMRYGKSKLREGVTRITDGIVNEFLIEGRDKAVLFDTGLDLFNIKDYVAKLTKKELMVINSHFHPDHANGNHHFDKVYIGAADLPTFTTADVYFRLVEDIVTATFERYPKTKKLQPLIDKLIMTKKGNTEYIPLNDGDEIDLGDKKLIVKAFPGHTPGSITLLDPALKFIYAGDASDMDIWMFTNPDCSLHEYAETGRRYYKEVEALGYTKYRGSHVPITHSITFMRDYAEWVDRLTPEKAFLKFNTPGGRSKLCIAFAPSAKHLLYTSIYWAHQCDKALKPSSAQEE